MQTYATSRETHIKQRKPKVGDCQRCHQCSSRLWTSDANYDEKGNSTAFWCYQTQILRQTFGSSRIYLWEGWILWTTLGSEIHTRLSRNRRYTRLYILLQAKKITWFPKHGILGYHMLRQSEVVWSCFKVPRFIVEFMCGPGNDLPYVAQNRYGDRFHLC